MISKLLSIVGHLTMIWCLLVVAGVAARVIWFSIMLGWGVM